MPSLRTPTIAQALSPAPPVNPFAGGQVAPTMPAPVAAPTAVPGAPQPQQPGPVANYVQGWKDFFQRVKAEPDLRLSLFQAALAMTQPAATWQEGVGRGLAAGQGTYDALQDQHYARGVEATRTAQEERKIGQQDRALDIGEAAEARASATLAQDQTQFTDRQAVARQELQQRLEQIRGDAEYQRETIRLKELELNQGGDQGQVNQRWKSLSDTLLRTYPSLFGEGPTGQDFARLYAWDLMNSTQSRAEMKAQIMNDQMLYLMPSGRDAENPQAVQDAMIRLDQLAESVLNSAGITDQRAVMPGTLPGQRPAGVAPPAAPAPSAAPLATPLRGGDQINYNGIPGVVIDVGDSTITIQFEGHGTQTLNRGVVERDAQRLTTRPMQ